MNTKDTNSRRSIVTGMGLAAAGIAAGASTAQAQGRSGFRPTRHEADAWLDDASGGHRIFVDSASAEGGLNAVLYATNLFSAHASAYDGDASDLDIVVCFRHLSTAFGYGDAIWEKYGEAIQNTMEVPDQLRIDEVTANPLNGGSSLGPAFTVNALSGRGARFAICENATRFFSGQLAQGTDSSPEDVFDELVASKIDNSRFVSAGVIALTRAQEYGYSLLYSG